ncbi:c-type cytochrome [Achromobacter xylosoxidans]|uniref:c-type cytochrome n=1 Tax=Alcaligenes xylosoxydans xylosoxydans TaxID=85698 RepID=UPI0006C6398A|nr:c-type cytochrome [Achromobacter xylosoxidans]CUJ09777.1 Cytochrome c [Achromobacter xylosoxidans]
MIPPSSRLRPLQVAVLALLAISAIVLATAIRNGRPTFPTTALPRPPADAPAERASTLGPAAAAPRPDTRPAFTPPSAASLPDTAFGKTVRQGEQIFLHTPQNAPQFAGNNLNCSSCHLDAGRRPDAAPMWAAYVMYPAYRAKNGHVNTLAERLQGCFRFSMNGKPPAADDPVLVALQTYMFWLADKAPTGVPLKGHGYPKLAAPPQKADYLRGSQVYARNCAVCHGDEGQGQKNGEHWVFPALWGPDSFNWGAGMHQIKNAAGFIKANMPLGRGGLLSDQEAWDVAYFMNAHERPQDPRHTESVAKTRAKYHDSEDSLYGLEINGHLLGSEAPPSGGRLAQGTGR